MDEGEVAEEQTEMTQENLSEIVPILEDNTNCLCDINPSCLSRGTRNLTSCREIIKEMMREVVQPRIIAFFSHTAPSPFHVSISAIKHTPSSTTTTTSTSASTPLIMYVSTALLNQPSESDVEDDPDYPLVAASEVMYLLTSLQSLLSCRK